MDDTINLYEVVEVCPYCGNEEIYQWNTDTMGYIAKCNDCGKRIFLCDICHHTDKNGEPCDWFDYCDWNNLQNGFSTCHRVNHKPISEDF